MADESDSGSIQSSVSDQSSDKKLNDQKRYYALYTFYPNRPRSIGDAALVEGNDQSEDGNLSLSIAATNLSASAETDLRKSLAQRLSRTPAVAGQGNFLSIGLCSADEVTTSAACYFCVLQNSSSQAVSEDDNKSAKLRKFVVCFISFFDSSLDLFRQDLDSYCEGLLELLDPEDENMTMGSHTPSSGETDDVTQG